MTWFRTLLGPKTNCFDPETFFLLQYFVTVTKLLEKVTHYK